MLSWGFRSSLGDYFARMIPDMALFGNVANIVKQFGANAVRDSFSDMVAEPPLPLFPRPFLLQNSI
jgi:hypothetical protein